MTQPRRPRRPAMLAPHQTESIVGDEDPAAYSELAHASAWAVLGVENGDDPQGAPSRVRRLIADDGIDVVAELWSRSPDFTLPGALWRVFLFAEWLRRDAALVEHRFEGGLAAYEAAQATHASPDAAPHTSSEWPSRPESVPTAPGLDAQVVEARDLPPRAVEHAIRQLFAGEYTEDTMDVVFSQAAALMRVLATGDAAASVWISSPTDPLAYPVSTRAHALVRTAQELEKAAAYARAGELD